jgi:AraC-like DNA-binding protein
MVTGSCEKSAVRHNEQAQLARRLLNRGYASPISIKQLSREVALSPYYLIRLFRRIYKQTPHQYLIQLRITKAKELLSSSDLSVTEICADVGFESLGSFSALFRKTVGISPSAYRRSGQARQKSAYIPMCVCTLHGISDTADQ